MEKMMFIVSATQLSGNQIRVFYDDGKVQHYPGKLLDFTTKSIITECSDGMKRVYFADGTIRHYA